MSENKLPIEVDDLVVLLLGAKGHLPSSTGRIEGITRLEKLVFLFEKEFEQDWLSEDPEFTAHNFGPFSSKVYKAVDVLAAAGLITDSARISSSEEDSWESTNIIGTERSDPYATRDFELTETGQEYFRQLLADLPPGSEPSIDRFKR